MSGQVPAGLASQSARPWGAVAHYRCTFEVRWRVTGQEDNWPTFVEAHRRGRVGARRLGDASGDSPAVASGCVTLAADGVTGHANDVSWCVR